MNEILSPNMSQFEENMIKKILVISLVSLLSRYTMAGILSPSGTLKMDNQEIQLQKVGEGLRAKKVAFMTFDVYNAKLWANNKSLIEGKGEMAILAIEKLEQIAIEMAFLRDVEGEKIVKAFEESLTANAIELKGPAKEFMTAMTKTGEIKKGQTIVVIGKKAKDGSEVITLENSQGSLTNISGPKGFIIQIFSLWLGKTNDDNLAKLKKSLLNN